MKQLFQIWGKLWNQYCSWKLLNSLIQVKCFMSCACKIKYIINVEICKILVNRSIPTRLTINSHHISNRHLFIFTLIDFKFCDVTEKLGYSSVYKGTHAVSLVCFFCLRHSSYLLNTAFLHMRWSLLYNTRINLQGWFDSVSHPLWNIFSHQNWVDI